MIKQYKLRFYNFRLVIFLLAISVIGIILVGSARDDLRSKQMIGVIMGLIFMVILPGYPISSGSCMARTSPFF